MKMLFLLLFGIALNANVIFIGVDKDATCNNPKVIKEICRILKDETGTIVEKIEVVQLPNDDFHLCRGIITVKNRLYKINFYTNGPNQLSTKTQKGYAVDVFNMHRNGQ